MQLHRRAFRVLAFLDAATMAGTGFASATAQEQPSEATFRGNSALTGEQPGPAPTGEPKLLWRFQTGDWIEAAPAIIDGVIYVGSDDGFLYAIGGS